MVFTLGHSSLPPRQIPPAPKFFIFRAVFGDFQRFVLLSSKISNKRLYRLIGFLITLLIIQIILGAFTIWSIKEPFITSIHVVNGAVILGVSTLLILRVSPVKLSW